jgi:hypothetical protein
MPFAAMDDEALNPIDVSLLSPDAKMLSSDYVTDLIQQFRFVIRGRNRYSRQHVRHSPQQF